MSWRIIIVVAILAGGSAMLIPAEDSESVPDSSVPETTVPTVGSTSVSTPQPTATTTPTTTSTSKPTVEPEARTAWIVTVVDVIDGDTMDVRLPNGSIETVRLLGVDTPETSVTQVSPSEWEDIPKTTDGRDWLVGWGDDATQYAEERLTGAKVYIRVDPEADRRGYYGRLLVYVYESENAETSLNERLLTDGYARYYDSTFSRQDAYQAAEETAREEEAGVWDYTASTTTAVPESNSDHVVISSIHEDAVGNDNENLNGEYVTFENIGDETVKLTGWTVSDEANHMYEFPAKFSLEPGASVRLYTGSGTDDGDELYWGENGAVWNNGGDTVVLKDKNGSVVDTRSY